MSSLPTRPVVQINFADFSPREGVRQLAEEVPVAFEYNGHRYAVMMASPRDLEDFAVGFSLSEGLVDRAEQVHAVLVDRLNEGVVLRITLPESASATILERQRSRPAEGSCGLCGIENVEDVLRPLPKLEALARIDAKAIARSLGALNEFQPLGRASGAMHAAAFCSPAGEVLSAREDTGRHNALDKLIGHLRRKSVDPASGFILLSARCSYELVEKTVRAGCPALVTISAPSDLAVDRAVQSGLTLVALARRDSALVLNDPGRLLS
ncbi:MAG: formate dehydrogenase accessory sulfurtransferase FdhD [Polyangiales bacterium]